MRRYCRAYPLGELRSFAQWGQGAAGDNDDEDPRTVVYMRDDFVVVRSPLEADQVPVYNVVTPAWREFCTSALGFSPPYDGPDLGTTPARGGTAPLTGRRSGPTAQ